MRKLDRGWIKNSGTQEVPEGWEYGDIVDVIHREGMLYFGQKIGRDVATTFRNSEHPSCEDILYFRGSDAQYAPMGSTVGKEIIEAWIRGEVKTTKGDNEVCYTELHVDSQTFHGLIEAISRDKLTEWSFNAGGKAVQHRTLTISNIKFIELKEIK